MISYKLKKICVIISLICMLASMASVCSFAVDPLSMNAMAAAADAFGMQYGVGTTYSVANAAGVESSFQDMWDEFQSYQTNQGDSYNYQDYYDNFNDKDIVQSFSHNSGKFSGFHFDSTDVNVFTKFWNWLLSGPAEMVKVDNSYEWSIDQSGNINPITIVNNEYAIINNYVLTKLPVTRVLSDNSETTYSAISGNLYALGINVSNTLMAMVVNLDSNSFQMQSSTNSTLNSTLRDGWYYYYAINSGSGGSFIPTLTYYESLGNKPSSYFGKYSDATISTTSDGLSIEPYKNAEVITLPDISDPSNIEPVDIITNIPWDDSYDQQEDQNGSPIPLPATDVPNIVNDWIDSIQNNTYELEEAENNDPQPPADEVYIPFLPVALPSFNFSFSGIWHYVREWVSSLGSFFTTLFAIWSALPYAMVVPVYATAVVVIVLGVYKRFFM